MWRLQGMDFTRNSYYGLWTHILTKNKSFNLKHHNDGLFLTKHISSLHKTLWWTGVVWIIVMFLSAVWTHSDGTHSLQRSTCEQSNNATFLQIWWRHKLGWSEGKVRVNCNFWGELFTLIYFSFVNLTCTFLHLLIYLTVQVYTIYTYIHCSIYIV